MARRRPGTHNVRRRFVEAHVLRALADDYRARLTRSVVDALEGDDGPSAEEQADLARRLRGTPQVAEALDRMWPRLSPHELLHDLLGARPLLAAAGQGILSSEASLNLCSLVAVHTLRRESRPKLILREVGSPSTAQYHDPYRQNRVAYRILRHCYRYADRIIALTQGGPAKLTYLTQYTRFENYSPVADVFEDSGS